MRSYLILGMCFLFLIQYFVGSHWLQYIVVCISLLAFVASSLKADRFPRIIGMIMMCGGISIEWSKGTGVGGISEGIFLILPLLCLITLVPLLSIPLRLGGFFESVSLMLRHLLHKPNRLYAGITGTLFIISPILNLGSVKIINEFLEELKLPSAMSAKSYVVGFSTAMLWSPYFASVTLVLHYLGVSYSDYFLYGMVLSLLSLLIGNILFAFWEKRHPLEVEHTNSVSFNKKHRNQLIKLVLFVIILLSSCLLVEYFTHWSMIVIVCLISVLFPLLFGILSWSWEKLLPALMDFRDRSVPSMNNEIMLFMSAGMLAFALKGTSVMSGVSSFLASLANVSFILFAIAVLCFVCCITYMGIHQIAAVGVLAMQLDPVQLGISNLSLALILMLTWTITTALSPFSGLNLLVSRFAHVSGRQLGFRINGFHLLIVAFIGITIISFVR
jgi:hypothetical protein